MELLGTNVKAIPVTDKNEEMDFGGLATCPL